MNIALLGYGHMGKAIEAVAIERGHHIGVTIDNIDEWNNKLEALRACDLAIDFSTPSTAINNIEKCLNLGLPVVVGTTGWNDHLESIVAECLALNGTLFVATNFSIGMNIMFELNRRLAQIMNLHPNYDVDIVETHHVHKLDAPSGTAVTLAEGIIDNIDSKDSWVLGSELWVDENGEIDSEHSRPNLLPNGPAPNQIPIGAVRMGETPGMHQVVYESAEDTITLSHNAKSRNGLAIGAVVAAEFILGKKGYFTMRDLLH